MNLFFNTADRIGLFKRNKSLASIRGNNRLQMVSLNEVLSLEIIPGGPELFDQMKNLKIYLPNKLDQYLHIQIQQ